MITATPTAAGATLRDLVPLGQVRKLLPANARGKDVSPRTVARWIHRGLRDGRRLEAVKVGGQLYVAPEALAAFLAPVGPSRPEIARQTVAEAPPRPAEQVRRLAEINAAEAELRAWGVLA
jgi:hypothetical protein